jgi:hypothetical protein
MNKFVSVNTEKPLMRSFSIIRLSLLAFAAFIFFSCTDKKEVFTTESVSDYIPVAVGKYITYRIDSTVYTNFGRTIETHKYQVKHVIEAKITDNEGRPSYRVFRYMRDTAGIQPWQTAGSYAITPLADQVEVIEDNLRFIKMHMPVKDGFSWHGNAFLPLEAYHSLYDFQNDNDTQLQDWDFYFDNISSAFSYRGINYTNVCTIEEADESINVPITVATAYASRSRAVEKYSKTIGLIYREYVLWDYQPNTTGSGGPFYTGFGIKMWMIDHN